MKIDWNTLVTVALAILLAGALKMLAEKAMDKIGSFEEDEEYEDFD